MKVSKHDIDCSNIMSNVEAQVLLDYLEEILPKKLEVGRFFRSTYKSDCLCGKWSLNGRVGWIYINSFSFWITIDWITIETRDASSYWEEFMFKWADSELTTKIQKFFQEHF